MESVQDIVFGCVPRPSPPNCADFPCVHPTNAKSPDLSKSEDLISMLSHDLKLRILVRLTLEEAVRVSMLSHSWRHFVKGSERTWSCLLRSAPITHAEESECDTDWPWQCFPSKFDPQRIAAFLGRVIYQISRRERITSIAIFRHLASPLLEPTVEVQRIAALSDSRFKFPLSNITVAEASEASFVFPHPNSLGFIILNRMILMVRRQKATLRSRTEHQDRISSLPVMALSNIVARLPLRDALCTRAVSKRWSSQWASTPLFLDDKDLIGSRHDQRVRAITRVLQMHPGPLYSIKLAGTCFDLVKPALPLWLRTLASKSVRELILINNPMPFDITLPYDILTCRDLRRLWVGFFRFPTDSERFPGSGRFPYLEQFGLLHTSIETNDLEHMLGESPVLETLAFVFSLGTPSQINVCKHPSLRCLILWLSVAEGIFVDAAVLERLVMWKTDCSIPGSTLKVQIAHAPSLRVLGYLEPALHQLQIGDTIIQAGTKASPNAIIPSVQILGLRVCFNNRNQSKLVPAYLGCFPNTSTLHIESTQSEGFQGKVNRKFWLESEIQCVAKSLKKIFFHEFQGNHSELVFLKYIAEWAPELEQMVITPSSQCLNDITEFKKKLNELFYANWLSSTPQLLVNQFGGNFCFPKSLDLRVHDPFFSMENLQIPQR